MILTMNTLHILQHAPKEDPGLIREWAVLRRWELHTVHVYRGEELPEPEGAPNLMLLGGPMNIYQHRDHPWLVSEKQMLARYVEAGSHLFGICLGAQLLADILGAKVTQNSVKEMGWFPVNFTLEARVHFPHLPESLTSLHWHGDTFSLPPDSVRLACSQGCPEQGFFWKNRVLGLQFHPEACPSSFAKFTTGDLEGIQPDEFVQDSQSLAAGYLIYPLQAKKVFFTLLDILFP